MASFKDLSDVELAAKLSESERAFVAARFKHSMNQLENTASLGIMRRDIARIKTEIGRREVSTGSPRGSLVGAHKSAAKRPVEEQAPVKGGFLSGIVDKLTQAE
jgi:large subunit ribosomal protein L29